VKVTAECTNHTKLLIGAMMPVHTFIYLSHLSFSFIYFLSLINLGTANLSAEKADPEDEEEDLCNATFSLAYGTRVLLHQTPFRVKIGRKYGLVGPNGAGKSTLMKAIAGGNLAGFPTELITVYVECEIIGEKADMTVLDYIMSGE